ncbi:hypothetical protein CEP54_006357 [Fusarium duplospermum]|uniref:Phospholipase/carboxylesterase/thioesterase domain-containing protein n=1 Tax=Fusarium duplospermum TaxID=1325734 RepID=A0A428Q746_9HYPO|nr:hypothetical protein CEP54_006357 [Fusarium duplospermum]
MSSSDNTPQTNSSRLQPGQFPPPIILPPLSFHNLTVIILHGRGFNAQKFHGPLLSSISTEPSTTLRESLSHARLVFPTAPLARATKYRRSLIHQWYEGTGDWEPEARGEMRPSVEHIHGILRDEIKRLGGDAQRVVLMGFSQGGAMTLVSSLLWDGDPLGAVVVMSGFMPLADAMMDILNDANSEGSADDLFERDPEGEETTPLQRAISELRQEAELDPASPTSYPFLSTPVFMGHGKKDQDVEYQHGRRAAELLERMGVSVEFNTYPDLAHWYNSDMLRDIVEFLDKNLGL